MPLNETTQDMDAATTPDIESTEGAEGPGDSLRAQLEQKNLAKGMSKEKLDKIAKEVSEGFEADVRSRKDWETNLKEWTDLALQVREQKTWPWVGASNVKYPLLSTAAMQFSARAYPSLVPASSDVVKVEVIGKDPTGQKLEKAKRIGTYMSYQVLNKVDNWEEDMDKLLIMLPIVGTMFKKTYYNPVTKQVQSELVLPMDIVVDYWAKSLETAERVSQIIQMNKRVMKEKMMSEIYLDIMGDLGAPQLQGAEPGKAVPTPADDTTPYTVIECHTYLDLDDKEDGYAKPYIVTFERWAQKILRIVPRFDERGIYEKDGKLQKICPIQYFTKFSFIPNPTGCFYDVGFGLLLTPLNEAVNTLINQQIDGGTLNNLQGGFLGRGLKLKMGESRWTPGEWKTVNSTADDLRKQIIPLPTKEPSKVLFELMGTLITSGKELASVAEIFVGKMPGQNTPATTTMATIEQGMKVFTAVYKRVYRSLKSEFKKVFELNGYYLDPEEYERIVDVQILPTDFSVDDYDVCPGADPNTATQTEKLMKAQGLMELLPSGVLDPVKVVQRVLEAQEQPNYEQLFNQQVQQTGQVQPPPDPKMLELQMKSQMDQQKARQDAQQKQFEMELSARDQKFQMMMQAQEMAMKERHEDQMATIKASAQYHMDQARVQGAHTQAQQKVVQNEQTHQQSMRHNEEKAKFQRSQQQQKPSPSGKAKK
jgi:chaperonin GroES